jgi:hypothetical protein
MLLINTARGQDCGAERMYNPALHVSASLNVRDAHMTVSQKVFLFNL